MMVLVIFIATGRDNSFLPGCPSVQVHPSGPACGHVRTGMISPIAISHTGLKIPTGIGPVLPVTGQTGPDRFRFRPVSNRPKFQIQI